MSYNLHKTIPHECYPAPEFETAKGYIVPHHRRHHRETGLERIKRLGALAVAGTVSVGGVIGTAVYVNGQKGGPPEKLTTTLVDCVPDGDKPTQLQIQIAGEVGKIPICPSDFDPKSNLPVNRVVCSNPAERISVDAEGNEICTGDVSILAQPSKQIDRPNYTVCKNAAKQIVACPGKVVYEPTKYHRLNEVETASKGKP